MLITALNKLMGGDFSEYVHCFQNLRGYESEVPESVSCVREAFKEVYILR